MEPIIDQQGKNVLKVGSKLNFSARQHRELKAYLCNPKGEAKGLPGPGGHDQFCIRDSKFFDEGKSLCKMAVYACVAGRKTVHAHVHSRKTPSYTFNAQTSFPFSRQCLMVPTP